MNKRHNKKSAFFDKHDLTRSDIKWLVVAVVTFAVIFTLSMAAVYSGLYNPLAV